MPVEVFCTLYPVSVHMYHLFSEYNQSELNLFEVRLSHQGDIYWSFNFTKQNAWLRDLTL